MTITGNHLTLLAQRVDRARVEVADERRQRNGHHLGHGSGAQHLLICLEAYVNALGEQHLPIPPTLRDELRLRRGL